MNFHDKEPKNDVDITAEIKDYLNGYFDIVRTKPNFTASDLTPFFSNEIESNIAGKRVKM